MSKLTLKKAVSLASEHERIHVTTTMAEPLVSTRDRLDVAAKPTGLWYGMGSSWLDWCGSEMPSWLGGYLFKVDIKTDRILQLTTPDAILAFTDEYGRTRWRDWGGNVDSIDWPAVAEKYCGIEIAPYQWSLRMLNKTFWYYGWDVASGVVWDPDAVDLRVEKLGELYKGGKHRLDKSWREVYKEGEQ